MKLPEDKKERTKILVAIGIGSLVVLYVLVQFGILPVLKSKKEKLAKIDQIKLDIGNADKEISQHAKDKVENLDTLTKITDISDKYVLKPVLGNYKISATEVIEPIVKKLNIKIEQLRQVGITAEANQTTLRSFSVRIALNCSYDELTRFIRETESKSPLLSIANISITGQSPENMEKHIALFDVQWPVWADLDMPVQLAKQLKDLPKAPETAVK